MGVGLDSIWGSSLYKDLVKFYICLVFYDFVKFIVHTVYFYKRQGGVLTSCVLGSVSYFLIVFSKNDQFYLISCLL